MLKALPAGHRKAGVVTHSHAFPLELVVYTANVPHASVAPEGMRWVPISDARG